MNEKTDEPLAFDRAEFAAEKDADAALACTACQRPIGGTYFTINDVPTCEDCHHLVAVQLKEARSGRAFLRAAGLGALAALGGSVAWYAVAKITGMEIGLLAIAVGYVVGKAVRHGSRSLGGRRYQALAMLLTYMSITGSYVPLVLKTLSERPPAAAAAAPSAAPGLARHPGATVPTTTSTGTSTGTGTGTDGEAGAAAPAPMGLVQIVVAGVLVFVIALVAPFLGGASNILGLVIIAIALYEAWKLNKRVPFVVAGPLRAAKPREPAADDAAAAG